MGTGIAIVANRKGGFPVKIIDSNEKSLNNSKIFIEKHFDREISKKTMTENDKETFMKRFIFSKNLSDLNEADFVIEVIHIIFNLKLMGYRL